MLTGQGAFRTETSPLCTVAATSRFGKFSQQPVTVFLRLLLAKIFPGGFEISLFHTFAGQGSVPVAQLLSCRRLGSSSLASSLTGVRESGSSGLQVAGIIS